MLQIDLHLAELQAKTSVVSTGMGERRWVGSPPRYVTSQLGQLSLASFW